MKNLRHTKIGIISFILILIVIIYMIVTTILDCFVYIFPNTFQILPHLVELIAINIIALIRFGLGIVARFEKESKKTLPTIAIVISGLFLIIFITGLML